MQYYLLKPRLAIHIVLLLVPFVTYIAKPTLMSPSSMLYSQVI